MGRITNDWPRRGPAPSIRSWASRVRQLASPRARRPLAALALAACVLLYLATPARWAPRHHEPIWSLDDGVGAGDVPLVNFVVPFKAGAWGSTTWPATIAYFVESVARQPHAVAVTILERDSCSEHLKELIADVPNIQLVCMTDADFWAEHVQYLCDSWGGCGRRQWRQMHADLMLLGDLRAAHAIYPNIQGFVFKDYVHPRAEFWGWTDLDVVYGDFAQAFPYDLVLDYDIIAPTEPGGPGPRLLFTRGHFTLVRNRASTEQAMRRYPPFATYAGFENQTLPSSDESIVPDFIVKEPGLDMLFFDGLHFKQIQSFSAAGVLEIPPALLGEAPHAISVAAHRALSQPLPGSRPSSVSAVGVEVPVTVHAGVHEPKPDGMDLWFDIRYASWYHAPAAPAPDWRRFVFKRAGQWTQRYEPPVYIEDGPLKGARSWLYIHWQEVKKRTHFLALRDLAKPSVWIHNVHRGILGLDDSNEQAFWLPVVDELCDQSGCVPPGETPAGDRPTGHKVRGPIEAAKRARWQEMRRQRHRWAWW